VRLADMSLGIEYIVVGEGIFMSPQTIVASGPAATHSRSEASHASLYLSWSDPGARPLGTYTETTRIPPQVADTARASGCRKPGAFGIPATGSFNPNPREDRHAVPGRLAMERDLVAIGPEVGQSLRR